MSLVLDMNTLDDGPLAIVNTISVDINLMGEAADTLTAGCRVGSDPSFEPPGLRLVDITQFHIILFICADRDPSIVFTSQVLLLELHLFRVL